MYNSDSPLSTTASIAGILTFVYAIIAGVFGYIYLLRSYTHSDASIERFYEAFAACALESDLVRRDILAPSSSSSSLTSRPPSSLNPSNSYPAPASRAPNLVPIGSGVPMGGSSIASALQHSASIAIPLSAGTANVSFQPAQEHIDTGLSPYLLDPDSLGRLYSHVRTVEIDLQIAAAKIVAQRPTGDARGLWDRILGRGRWVTRAGELEASLGKREALTSRLLVVQMSLASGRMRVQANATSKLERRVEMQDLEIKELKEKMALSIRELAGSEYREKDIQT